MLGMNVVVDAKWSQLVCVLEMDKTSSIILEESSEWSAAVITGSELFFKRRFVKGPAMRVVEAVGRVCSGFR